MGVPVLTSDLRGIREQCGDAAILVDPTSVESIADGDATPLDGRCASGPARRRGTAALRSVRPAEFQDRLAAILRDVGKACTAATPESIPA